jgi:hypothetical protein
MLREGTETRQCGRTFTARDFLMRLMLLGGSSVAGITSPLVGTGVPMLIAAGMITAVALVALVMGQRLGMGKAAA